MDYITDCTSAGLSREVVIKVTDDLNDEQRQHCVKDSLSRYLQKYLRDSGILGPLVKKLNLAKVWEINASTLLEGANVDKTLANLDGKSIYTRLSPEQLAEILAAEKEARSEARIETKKVIDSDLNTTKTAK
jgi:hypothetical protein